MNTIHATGQLLWLLDASSIDLSCLFSTPRFVQCHLRTGTMTLNSSRTTITTTPTRISTLDDHPLPHRISARIGTEATTTNSITNYKGHGPLRPPSSKTRKIYTHILPPPRLHSQNGPNRDHLLQLNDPPHTQRRTQRRIGTMILKTEWILLCGNSRKGVSIPIATRSTHP
jgi:hypothetical protein